jgi:site-specific recombinase XerD
LEGRETAPLQDNGKDSRRKPAGVNRYLSTIKRVFSYAVKSTKKMSDNPAAQVKYLKENNERVRWLSEEEEKRLFEALPKQYHAMVIVALNSGLS